MAGIAEVWFLGTDVAVQRDAGAIDCCVLSHGGRGKVDCCRRMLLSTADSSFVRVSTAGHRLYHTKGVTGEECLWCWKQLGGRVLLAE